MDDDIPRTKQPILDRFQRACSAFDEALAKLSDEQLLARPAGGGWSARDVLAHVSADNRWFGAQLQACAEDRLPGALESYGTDEPPPPGADLSTQDGRNAAQHERNRGKALEEIRREHAEYRARLLELIRALPDAEFERDYAIADNGHIGWVRPATESEQGFPLWRWLQGNTWHHYEDHLPEIQAAAAR